MLGSGWEHEQALHWLAVSPGTRVVHSWGLADAHLDVAGTGKWSGVGAGSVAFWHKLRLGAADLRSKPLGFTVAIPRPTPVAVSTVAGNGCAAHGVCLSPREIRGGLLGLAKGEGG